MRSLGVYSLVIYHRPTTAKRTTNYSSPCERSTGHCPIYSEANYQLQLALRAIYYPPLPTRYQLRQIYGRYTVHTRQIHGTLVYSHRTYTASRITFGYIVPRYQSSLAVPSASKSFERVLCCCTRNCCWFMLFVLLISLSATCFAFASGLANILISPPLVQCSALTRRVKKSPFSCIYQKKALPLRRKGQNKLIFV